MRLWWQDCNRTTSTQTVFMLSSERKNPQWVVPRRMWTNSIKRTSLCLVESLSPLIYSLYREQPLLKTFQYFSTLLVSAAYQRQSYTLLGFAYFFFALLLWFGSSLLPASPLPPTCVHHIKKLCSYFSLTLLALQKRNLTMLISFFRLGDIHIQIFIGCKCKKKCSV